MLIPKVKAVVTVLLSVPELSWLLELLRLFEEGSRSGDAVLGRVVGAKKLSRFIGVENKDISVFALVFAEPQG